MPRNLSKSKPKTAEKVLETDATPLEITYDGRVIIPMSVFHSINKKDYDNAWAATVVKILPAFNRAAIDRSGHVNISHSCASNTPSNRAAMLKIVRDDIFGPSSNPHIRDAYNSYIERLYSNQNGELEAVSDQNSKLEAV